jgi:chorismate mutase
MKNKERYRLKEIRKEISELHRAIVKLYSYQSHYNKTSKEWKAAYNEVSANYVKIIELSETMKNS